MQKLKNNCDTKHSILVSPVHPLIAIAFATKIVELAQATMGKEQVVQLEFSSKDDHLEKMIISFNLSSDENKNASYAQMWSSLERSDADDDYINIDQLFMLISMVYRFGVFEGIHRFYCDGANLLHSSGLSTAQEELRKGGEKLC